nr:GNAT family N-acetyltransferase [Clostridium ganghwense]
MNNIVENYVEKGHTFLVALYNNEVIGTGALIKEKKHTGRIVRMSVDKRYRGRGVAKKILRKLEQIGRNKGYKEIVLETNNDWHKAIGLYKRFGYIECNMDEESIHFIKNL